MKNIESGFCKWLNWENRNQLPNLQCPGVYTIAYSSNCIAGTDFNYKDEIVYFGVASHLGKRLRQFDKTISRTRICHGGADRVLHRYKNYTDLISKLYVSTHVTSHDKVLETPNGWRAKGDAKQLEYYCIAKYLEEYDRLPLFNDPSSQKFSKTTL